MEKSQNLQAIQTNTNSLTKCQPSHSIILLNKSEYLKQIKVQSEPPVAHLVQKISTHQKVRKTIEMLTEFEKGGTVKQLSTQFQDSQNTQTQLKFKTTSLHKKHLIKLWVSRLYKYYKPLSLDFPNEQSTFFKELSAKKNISKLEFKQFLLKCQNIRFALFHAYFDDDQALGEIYNSNLKVDSKYALVSTYITMKNALAAPEQFISLSKFQINKISEAREIQSKCENMNLAQIKKVISEELLKIPSPVAKKGSAKNNITYAWISILRKIIRQAEFIGTVNNDLRTNISTLTAGRQNMKLLRTLLGIPELNTYIKERKIQNEQLVHSIVSNQSLNISLKHNLLMSYDRFVQAVNDPSNLTNWKV